MSVAQLPEPSAHTRTRGRRAVVLVLMALAATALAAPAGALALNPVQAENALPGDTGWSAPETTAGLLEGYADRTSALPGDMVNVKVSTTSSATYRIEVYRLGWYGGAGGRLMTCLPSCSGSKAAISQPYPTPNPTTGLIEPNWSTTDSFTVGSDWVSGYYLVLLKLTAGASAGQSFSIPLIVRAPASRPKVMLVQAAPNNWQAYNKWGGKSLYNSNSTGQVHADMVSFDRPLHNESQSLYDYEIQFLRFAEREGYDVAYQSDYDTHANPLALRGYKLVASVGHDEYWTKEMRDAFEGARDAGVNLAFFGANISYWQMRYADNGRTIVEYKDRSADPEPDQALKTIQFRVLIPPRPECQMIGVQYEGAISNNAYRAYTVDPAALSDPWLAGTGFTTGATVPQIVGYEWDLVVPGCAVPGTPKVLLHYAGGSEPNADAVRYTAPSGAKVFATGTLNWSWKLDGWSQPGEDATGHAVDARIQALTRNVLNDLTSTTGTPPANQPPAASFTRSPSAPLIGQSVTFTDTSTDSDGTIAARAWDLDDDGNFNDGTGATAQRTFTAAGIYTVRLRVTDDDGDSSTTSMTFSVGTVANVPPAASFTRDIAAPTAGQAVTFTDTSTDSDGTIAARAWDLDDDGQYDDGTGATAQQTFAAAGTYTVRLRVTDDSGDSATAAMAFSVSGSGGTPGQWTAIQHKGQFTSASATTLGIAPAAALTTGSLVVVAVAWADQTSAVTVTDTLGNAYTAVATPARYAGSRSVQLFYARNVTGGATTITATFSAAVTNRFVGISEYGGMDPVAPLVASANGNGGSGTSSAVPVTTTAPGQLVFAVNQNGGGGIASVSGSAAALLDSGAGNSVGDAHDRAAAAGSNAITFNYSSSGAWATQTAAFRARSNAAPVASLTRDVTAPAVGQAVTFTDTSTDLDGTIAARAWDLDDDGQYDDGTGATAVTSFATAGTHTVRLRVTDNGGATATAAVDVAVGPPPNSAPAASFARDVTSPIAGDTVTFTDTSTDSDGTIAARAWDLDDDGSYNDGTGATAQRAFASAGTYTVGLRVTDDGGAAATATMTVVVGSVANVPPTASFTRDLASPVAGQAVTFTDTSSDGDGTIAARAWDLDNDGSYNDGTGATAQRTFASAGIYTVGLRVTDDRGGTATTTMTFTVLAPNVPPTASFTRDVTSPVAGDTVTFTDTSTDSDGTIAARAWDLDNDGNFNDGTGATAQRTFALAGTYTVRLRVTDDRGGTATATMTVTVLAPNVPPTASFTRSVSAPVSGQTVTFTDTSTDSDGTIAARAWDLDDDGNFNDGSGATAQRTFAVAGTYTVRLRVTDNRGGTATATMTVTVAPWANIQRRASYASGSSTTLALATTSATTAGDLLVVGVGWGSQTTTATVTDSRGNAYTAIGTPTPYGTSGRLQLFYARVATAGTTTVTARFSASSSTRFIAISQYRGLEPLTPLVAFGGASGTGTDGAAPVAATAAGQLIVAVARTAATAGISSVTGNAPTLLNTANGGRHGHAMDSASGAGSRAITFRTATSAAWASAAAAFAPAGTLAPPG